MPIHLDSFKNNLKLELDNNPQLNGLDNFKRTLEKDYFSQITIRNCPTENGHGNLVIEMDCNFDLVEALYHMQNETWGKIQLLEDGRQIAAGFNNAFAKLNELSGVPIDIEEFSIFLNDSSIIVKKIYEHSIVEQFGNILSSVAEHYVHLTRGLEETPFEIYIPVFEEDILENDMKISQIRSDKNDKNDYFGFWGLYFESEEDAVIYDLADKSFISGDLYMLNH